MPLTDTASTQCQAYEKPVRIFDGGGLYVMKSPLPAASWWRLVPA
jgi:hypothetical protein